MRLMYHLDSIRDIDTPRDLAGALLSLPGFPANGPVAGPGERDIRVEATSS